MGRYRSYRSRYQRYNYSKFNQLESMFGDAVGDVRNAFLTLDNDAREALLDDYESFHGDSAARYARNTFPKWQNGTTQLSGQTMERLIELVPPYLSADQRFQLLRGVVR